MPTITFIVEMDAAKPDPPPEPVVVPACEELGRTTRAYVSGYQRTRVHRSRLVRGEKRCLVADFNGAIPAARSIASVTWRATNPSAAFMADAGVVEGGRSARVDVTAGAGCSRIKCEVTLDNGEVYNQLFEVASQSGPWFQGESALQTGPYELTAVAL